MNLLKIALLSAIFYSAAIPPAVLDPGYAFAAPKEKAKKGKGSEDVAVYQYVELDPLVFPVIGKSGVAQTISLKVMLEIEDASRVERVKGLAPRLTDAYIQDMYGTLGRGDSIENGILMVAPIKERLMTVTEKVVGGDVVNNVLLQVVQQKPL
jgi:flagellar FliL protein